MKMIDDFYEYQLQNYIDGGMPELQYLGDFVTSHNGNNAIDIGANVGELTYYFLTRCGINKVYAFEPNIDLIPQLNSLNSESNRVDIFNCALSNENGVGTLIIPFIPESEEFNTGIASLSEEWVEDMHKLYPEAVSDIYVSREVPTTTLDSFNLMDVRIIKIDVEGFEYKVIEGAKQTITNNNPIIIIETLDRNWLHLLVKELNYKCYIFDQETKSFCHIYDIRNVASHYVNFILVPNNET